MINLHERMLPTSAGVEPATSWSPVGRRIQLSHRGRHLSKVQSIYGGVYSTPTYLTGRLRATSWKHEWSNAAYHYFNAPGDLIWVKVYNVDTESLMYGASSAFGLSLSVPLLLLSLSPPPKYFSLTVPRRFFCHGLFCYSSSLNVYVAYIFLFWIAIWPLCGKVTVRLAFC